MFINLSNHPSNKWEQKQRQAAEIYGEIIDIDFPLINPEWSTNRITNCANDYFKLCKDKIGKSKNSSAVHLAGEPVFCFMLAQMLLRNGYTCLTSTTKRNAQIENGIKTSCFDFVGFRKYKLNDYLVKEQKSSINVWNWLFHEIKQNCKTYFLLFLLFAVEWILYRIVDYPCETFLGTHYWTWGIILSVGFVLFLFYIWYQKGISLSIMKRFFNNALGLKFLSFVFILSFLIHISWLSDTCLDFFVLNKGGENIWKILISFIGILGLLIIFPIRKRANKVVNPEERTFLVTGIQDINERSLDLLLKPFKEYSNIEKVLILLSIKALTNGAKVYELQEGAKEEAEAYVKAIEEYNNSEEKEKRIKGHIVCEKLEIFLQKKIECLNNEYLNKKVKCVFSEVVDYDNFDNCYKILKEELRKEEISTKNTIIHVSPGTKIVSGVMTIFAIKGKRALIYTRQDNSQLDTFDIDVWTTKDLLDELWDEAEISEE